MAVLYISVFVFLLVVVGFVFVALAMSRALQTQGPTTDAKITTYECGELPMGVVFRDWLDAGHGAFALLEIGVFVALLVLGLAYVWVKGDIKWVKETRRSDAPRGALIDPPGRRAA